MSEEHDCGDLAEQHSCPYQEDVNNNEDPEFCNCCDECVRECLDDI